MVKWSRAFLALLAFALLAVLLMPAASGRSASDPVNASSDSPDGYCTLFYGLQSTEFGYVGDARVTLCQMVTDEASLTGYDLVPLDIPDNPLSAANYLQTGEPFYMFKDVPYQLPCTRYAIIVERNGRVWNSTIMAGPYNTEGIPILQVDDTDNVVPAIASPDNKTIYGWTRDLGGNDVAGVTVTLMCLNGTNGAPELAAGVSSNPVKSAMGSCAGLYCFRNVMPGWYTISVEKDGHRNNDTFYFPGDNAGGFLHNVMLLYETSGIERAVDAMPDVPDLSDSGLYNATAINATNATSTDYWTASLNETIRTIAPDGAGGVFAFGKDTVYRLGADGGLLWRLTIPSQWCLSREYWRVENTTDVSVNLVKVAAEPVYDVNNGSLYLYLTPSAEYPCYDNSFNNSLYAGLAGLNWSVVALSPDGTVAWMLPLAADTQYADSTAIHATDDRVYVFHDYSETVVDRHGTVLFTLQDISDPAAVDEAGNVYAVLASPLGPDYWKLNRYDPYMNSHMPDYRTPSSTIVAYGPAGQLLWRRDLAADGVYGDIIRQYIAEDIRSQFGTLPLYQNGTLYAPVYDGVVALDLNGTVQWSASPGGGSFRLFEHMPLDDDGNLYLVFDDGQAGQDEAWLYMVSDDGKKIIGPRKYSELYDGTAQPAAQDGIVYYIMARNLDFMTPVENMPYAIVTAYDIRNGTILWAYRIDPGAEHEMVINRSNVNEITDFINTGASAETLLGTGKSSAASSGQANEAAFAGVYPAKDRIYILFAALKYEYPVTFGVSRAAYASDIYVLNLSGQPFQRTDTQALVTAVAVNNSTIYYCTTGGVVTGPGNTAPDIVAGVVLLAALAVGTKLLLAAVVTRARTRLNKNENRNSTMGYIREHPGSTMYEISRGMEMNIGTVRYHLLILGLNHKIVSFGDGKFIRYFPNSNSYTQDEQQAIALLRREPTRDIIKAVGACPGLTNAEIARTTGQSYSSISKFLKELCGKGILVREEYEGSIYYRMSGKYAILLAGLITKVANDEWLTDSLKTTVSGSWLCPAGQSG